MSLLSNCYIAIDSPFSDYLDHDCEFLHFIRLVVAGHHPVDWPAEILQHFVEIVVHLSFTYRVYIRMLFTASALFITRPYIFGV